MNLDLCAPIAPPVTPPLPETGANGPLLLILAISALGLVAIGYALWRRGRMRQVAAFAAVGLALTIGITTTTATPASAEPTPSAAATVAGDPSTASIAGWAFIDADEDGTQNDAVALAGVTVTLRTSAGADVATATTGADGRYAFPGLAGGSYLLAFPTTFDGRALTVVDQGSTTTDSDPDPATGVTKQTDLAPCQELTGLDAGYGAQQPGAITGMAFYDEDRTGVFDTGNPAIAGLTVRLLDAEGTEVATTTTGADGTYSFTSVPVGTYVVEFPTTHEEHGLTAQNVGTEDIDSDANKDTGRTEVIVVTSGGTVEHVDGGYLGHVQSSISGRVFVDGDRDGTQNDAVALTDVTVTLFDATDAEIASKPVEADGSYVFGGLDEGTYTVQFTDPNADHLLTAQHVGAADQDSDPAPGTGRTGDITVGHEQIVTRIDAGYQLPSGTISGFAFLDGDGDGTQDEKTYLSGVTVDLLDATSAVVATATTAADGSYTFTGLNAGAYSVKFATRAGHAFTTQTTGDTTGSDADTTGIAGPVTLPTDGEVTHIDGGYLPTLAPAAISGRTWADTNGDGTQDDAVALPGVAVELLDDSSSVLDTTTTDANGRYAFTGLGAGSYAVRFATTANGRALTLQDQGTADDKDSDAEEHTGATAAITLTASSVVRDIDAGYVAGAIRGDTFLDANDNAVQDTGEVLAGITVTLYGAGGAVVATQITDSDGGYAFTGLAPGDYRVGFPTSHKGYVLVAANQGGDQTVDSDADATGATGALTIAGATVIDHVDAGYKDPRTGVIGDKMWHDYNRDGIQNDTQYEWDTITAAIALDRENSTGGWDQVATTTTAADGTYRFSNLAAGTYRVRFNSDESTEYPFNVPPSPSNVGSDEFDSDAGSDWNTSEIVLSPGESDLTVDAGLSAQTS